MRRRLPQLMLGAILLAAAAGCEEDSPVVLETGTARLYPSAPGRTGFRWQEFKEPERFVQAAKWDFLSASFSYPGVTVDLAATPSGPPCGLRASIEVRDPTLPAPVRNGQPTFDDNACNLGVVIDSLPDGAPATLDVTFVLTVYRAEPNLIQQGGTALDYDGDGLLNANDPCPIIRSRMVGEQNIRDCSFTTAMGQFQSDQDADGVADPFDNCVWVANGPEQADEPAGNQTNTIGGVDDDLGIRDAIGDACERQEASTGMINITYDATLLVQPQNLPTFVVLDFDFSPTALDCNWDAGSCVLLDPSAVGYCITTNPSEGAFTGCI